MFGRVGKCFRELFPELEFPVQPFELQLSMAYSRSSLFNLQASAGLFEKLEPGRDRAGRDSRTNASWLAPCEAGHGKEGAGAGGGVVAKRGE